MVKIQKLSIGMLRKDGKDLLFEFSVTVNHSNQIETAATTAVGSCLTVYATYGCIHDYS